MELIGTKIQSLRRNKRLTQSQLAEVLSVSAQSVSKWENHLSVIARYFGVTMDELFSYRLDSLNYKERFIRFMADNGVLRFGEFRLQCGRISPYLIDTGNYKSASQISRLGEFYAECLRENNMETNLLVGNTPRDIPIMIATSMVLFNRYGVDVHYAVDRCVGKQFEPTDRITLIKDTLTTGNTLKNALQRLQEDTGQQVSHIVVSVDRAEKHSSHLLSARHEIESVYGVNVHAIVTLDDIIRSVENGIAGMPEHLEALKRYKDQYGGD